MDGGPERYRAVTTMRVLGIDGRKGDAHDSPSSTVAVAAARAIRSAGPFCHTAVIVMPAISHLVPVRVTSNR